MMLSALKESARFLFFYHNYHKVPFPLIPKGFQLLLDTYFRMGGLCKERSITHICSEEKNYLNSLLQAVAYHFYGQWPGEKGLCRFSSDKSFCLNHKGFLLIAAVAICFLKLEVY